MGILKNANLPSSSQSSNGIYNISLMSDDNYQMNKNGVKYLVDTDSYVGNYAKRIVGNTYNSALILGLGMGIIPYYMINNCSTNTVDILEMDQELIDYVTQLNYLDFQKINVIKADALTYNTQSTYDIIIVDIYFGATDEYMNTEKQMLINNYNKNLNQNGKFYSPIDYTYIDKT